MLNKHDPMGIVIDLFVEHIVALHVVVNRYCDIFVGEHVNRNVQNFPNPVVQISVKHFGAYSLTSI